MKKQSREAVSKLEVLEIISDKISLDIFNEIAKNSHNSDSLKRTIGVSNKQYYSRYSRLIKAGLIKKKTGTHILTAFGKVTYQAQLKIARIAQRNYTLKYVDALAANTSIPTKERQEVIDKLIDDAELKSLVIQLINS